MIRSLIVILVKRGHYTVNELVSTLHSASGIPEPTIRGEVRSMIDNGNIKIGRDWRLSA